MELPLVQSLCLLTKEQTTRGTRFVFREGEYRLFRESDRYEAEARSSGVMKVAGGETRATGTA